MKILVTGGLGFIGHNVVRELEQLGHSVVITDTRTTYGIISPGEINYLMSERAKRIQTTAIYDINIVSSTIDWLVKSHRPDIVIHMASFPRQKVVNSNPQLGSQSMSEGLLNLLEAAKKYQVSRFVYISSSMVYGDFENGVDETAECRPQGAYGIMKLAGEWLTRDYTRDGDMSHVIVRPSAVYGPLDVEDRVVARFISTARRGGTLRVNGAGEVLDFSYVDDVALGIVAAALSDRTSNRTYNITCGQGRSLLEAAELAVKIAGQGHVQVCDRDRNFPSRGALSIARAQQDFDYSPATDIEQGFENYYLWLQGSTYWNTK
jgi:nucleoside-diphosphate-sugar epimerase